MPITFLNSFERQQYQEIPQDIGEDVLNRFFYLNEKDMKFAGSFYGSVNRTAVSILIGLIRYLGYVPDHWKEKLPESIFDFISGQLGYGILFADLSDYGKREQTETDHFRKILDHLKFRRWQPLFDGRITEEWLVEKGMVHDRERYLLDLLCRKLHDGKILRPSTGTLEAAVGGIRDVLVKETYNRLSFLWTADFLGNLDKILEPDREMKITPHRWLCNIPGGNTSADINRMLEKYDFLIRLGVQTWDLSCLSENRKKQLANLVRNTANTDLQRINRLRLYPMPVCFLKESLMDITDIIMTMYGDYWQQIINRSKRALDCHLIKTVKSQQHAIQTIIKTGKMVVDESIENEELRVYIYKILPKVLIQEALTALTEKDVKGISWHSFLSGHYSSIKRFSLKLLSTFQFKVAFTVDNFEAALNLVKNLQNDRKKKIPQDAPMNFIGTNWQKIIIQDGKINQQNYELCVLHVLRERLQSGDVCLDWSRKFTSLESLLISKPYWMSNKDDICQKLSLPDLPGTIDEKTKELFGILPLLTEKLSHASDIRMENDVLIISPLIAEEIPWTAIKLQQQINARLPEVTLPEMIREVDTWINYSEELSGEHPARNPNHLSIKYAVLFANACNLSLADLSRSSDLEYQTLWWVSNHCFHDDNLKKANNRLVNFHYRQRISQYWGGGVLSSSDGQRFPTDGKIRNAASVPKYFGYGKGVGIYTHTADQYSQFGSQIISVHERDATYVLNEILANETDLPLNEHTTDTHGYTDLNFALFDLAGKQFSPRIRDLKTQRLYKISGKDLKEPKYPPLKFTGIVNIDYLKRFADDMTRVAASLKTGTVTPSTLIGKLQAYPKQNNLMYVLRSYGQFVKTVFICKYLLDKSMRKKINAQLNKGEQLHGLRAFLWFGGDGIIRKKQENDQQITARSLNLLTNIIIVWNTVYIQEIVKQLQLEGFQINQADFEHISPAPFEHINRLGKYSFDTDFKVEDNGLRPLRKSSG
jgi:TnpA family transposase